MNIPTIEELHKIGSAAAAAPANRTRRDEEYAYLTAIRDAVVAACRPQLRPIAEMPAEVPEGCTRFWASLDNRQNWFFTTMSYDLATHFIDIALPSPTYPADFEQAFAESKLDAKDKDAAFKLWKGGAR